MEYIQGLFSLAQDYWILTMIVGLFSTFIESFFPALPLIAIVTINAAIFGLGIGLIISWIGSGVGTLVLFLIVSKFSDNKFINKYRNEKVEKIVNIVRSKGFKLLFIAYACPFIPACLVTISSALCKYEFKHFATAMLSGKFIMFFIVSYIGSDIKGFIISPVKIIVLALIVLLAWLIGNKVNLSLEHSEKLLEINKDVK